MEVRSLAQSDYGKVIFLVQALPQSHKTSFIFECKVNQCVVFLVILEIGNSSSSIIFMLLIVTMKYIHKLWRLRTCKQIWC